jgi:hypothetical protein
MKHGGYIIKNVTQERSKQTFSMVPLLPKLATDSDLKLGPSFTYYLKVVKDESSSIPEIQYDFIENENEEAKSRPPYEQPKDLKLRYIPFGSNSEEKDKKKRGDKREREEGQVEKPRKKRSKKTE